MKCGMKTGLVLCGVFAILVARSAVAEEANKADHDALRHLRVVFQDAVARNDMESLRPYLATNFSVVTFTDREFTNFDGFTNQWQKTRAAMLGKEGSYRVDLNPEYSVLLGDIALCRGNSRNVLVDGKGHEYAFDAHWSVVCQKQAGEWKIVRGHNSLDPFGNPMLKQAVRGIVVKVAVVAFLGGLALGLFGMWCVRRRTVGRV